MEDEKNTARKNFAHGDRASFDASTWYAAKTEEVSAALTQRTGPRPGHHHDLFLKIWQNRGSMARRHGLRLYLFRMARNAVRPFRQPYGADQLRPANQSAARIRTSGRGQPRPAAADSAGGGEDAQAAARIFRMSREEGHRQRRDRPAPLDLHAHRRKPDFESLVRTAQTRHADPVFF